MRILFVAMSNSIHTARWIGQLQSENWDLHLFPAENTSIHHGLRDVTIHGLVKQRFSQLHPSVRQTGWSWPFRKGRTKVERAIKWCAPEHAEQATRLSRTIQFLKPDVLHTLEMQRGGYLSLKARELSRRFAWPPWIFSCWGNDIYLFGRQEAHQKQIRDVLETCDYFTADCKRDLRLAKEFGLKGQAFGVFPGPGGFDISRMRSLLDKRSVSTRRIIAVKGYQSDTWGGRALVAIQALKQIADQLKDYEVVVFSTPPNSAVAISAAQLALTSGIRIRLMSERPHDEIVRLMGHARIYLGLSMSDGTPNTMLEAMVMGAFPIQSDTGSTAEWIQHGRNGFLVSPEDPIDVANAIQLAIENDDLVDRAAELNEVITKERIDAKVVAPRVIDMYKTVVAESGNCRSSFSDLGELCVY